MLSVKYVVLNRIGTINWVPTTHSSHIATGLARFIYSVGTGTEADYGSYIFDQTMQHGKSWAIRMPIAFPSLIYGMILSQHHTVAGWKKFHYITMKSPPIFIYPKGRERKISKKNL
jgi:SNF family Na+-dependent transporter